MPHGYKWTAKLAQIEPNHGISLRKRLAHLAFERIRTLIS